MKILVLLFAALLVAGCGEASELSELRAKAVGGDAKAQNNLGNMYYNGEGVPEDHKEAVKWYRKAAEQGHAIAQNNLGVMYGNGEGVQEDHKEAVKWYRKAAEQGHAIAQYNLGAMYYNGEGVLEHLVTAYAWWNIAAANGHEDAKAYKPIFAKKMTPEQIAKAQELSSEMIKKNPKLLN